MIYTWLTNAGISSPLSEIVTWLYSTNYTFPGSCSFITLSRQVNYSERIEFFEGCLWNLEEIGFAEEMLRLYMVVFQILFSQDPVSLLHCHVRWIIRRVLNFFSVVFKISKILGSQKRYLDFGLISQKYGKANEGELFKIRGKRKNWWKYMKNYMKTNNMKNCAF